MTDDERCLHAFRWRHQGDPVSFDAPPAFRGPRPARHTLGGISFAEACENLTNAQRTERASWLAVRLDVARAKREAAEAEAALPWWRRTVHRLGDWFFGVSE